MPSDAVSSSAAPQKAPVAGQLLFYQRPEALTATAHGDLHVTKEGDFNFAKATNSVAIMSTEFVSAMRSYPIVFAAGAPCPMVVLGLEQANLFVDDAGQWRIGSYVPAYIRRYPFVFIAHPDGKQFVLGIDRASSLLEAGGEGPALFKDGKPTDVTQNALAFCGAYQNDYTATTAFVQALEAEKLLVDNRAEAKMPGGKTINLQGFRVVDRQKFANLADATVVDWHKKGWLALVHYHMASLERFADLLELAGVPASR